MSTLFSIGQMNQLADGLENAGFTPDDVTKLRSYAELSAFKDVLWGYAKIVKVRYIINCDASPFLPKDWKVEEHRPGGEFEWEPAKVMLYLSLNQQNGKVIQGHELRKELANQPILNACVLDYLIAHPVLIPDEWKDKLVCFWGTIYRDSDGCLVVRCLGWHGGRWGWDCRWLDNGFVGNYPAAVSASI